METRRVALTFGVVALVLAIWVESAAAQGKTRIVFWTMLDHKSTNVRSVAERTMVEKFMAANPDIDVEVQSIPWTELTRKTIVAVAAGKGPDVARISFSQFREHIDHDTLIDLDPFVKDVTPEQRRDYLAWGATTWQGKKKSFILAPLVNAIFYRKDLFARTGMEPPRTWDELAKAAKAMTTPEVWGFGFALQPGKDLTDQYLFPYIWGAGEQPFDAAERATWNNTSGQAAIQFFADMMLKHKAMPRESLQYSLDDVLEGFRAGRYAMIIDGSNRYAHANSSKVVEGKIGLWRLPSPDGKTSSPPNMMGWSVGVTKSATNPQAAWRFVQHMVSPESTLINAKVAGEVPSRVSVLKDPWFETPAAAHIKWFLSYLQDHNLEMPHPHNVGKLRQVIVNAVHEIVLAGKPVKEALDKSVAEYNRSLPAK